VKACEDVGIPLVINHQRRVGADLVEARQLIESGAIGDLVEVRGYCGGDILSDGTHLIDSLLFLAGDPDAEWVSGQINRDLSSPIWHPKSGPPNPRPGFRYGHAVESGGMGLALLKNGIRLSIYCGDHQRQHAYQDYDIVGTKGRLWRNGDSLSPNLFIQDAEGGNLDMIFDEKLWHHLAVPSKTGRGLWRAVNTDAKRKNAIQTSYEAFAQTIHTGAPHPMNARVAMRGLEVVMAGHAGDGNLHPSIFFDPAVEGSQALAKQAFTEIVETALRMGGTITGEHGVGTLKAPWLPLELGAAEIERQRGIKALFDPRGVLNPGRVYAS